MYLTLISILFSLHCYPVDASATLELQLMPTGQGARCLDGSPSGYYYQYGSGTGLNKWVINFQGGGVCESESTCTDRSEGDLGSSKSWGKTHGGKEPLQNNNKDENPLAYNWNYIYVPYVQTRRHTIIYITSIYYITLIYIYHTYNKNN